MNKIHSLVVKILLLFPAFFLVMCKENEGSKYYENKIKAYSYNVFEPNKDGLITPKYTEVDENYKGINQGAEAFYFRNENVNLKSFIAFPKMYEKGTFISFSDDSIYTNDKLRVYLDETKSAYDLYYKNSKMLNQENLGNLRVYHIPPSISKMDSIKIISDQSDFALTFTFIRIEKQRPRKDSLLFYSTISEDMVDLENLKAVLNPD